MPNVLVLRLLVLSASNYCDTFSTCRPTVLITIHICIAILIICVHVSVATLVQAKPAAVSNQQTCTMKSY